MGLEREVLDAAVPMRGRMMHAVSGETRFLAYGSEREFIHSMSRGGVNALLMDAAERARAAGGGEVSFHFKSRLTAYDTRSGGATFRDESGADRLVAAPTIFGADGSASVLRAALREQHGIPCSEELLDFGYKELTLPAARGAALGTGGRFSLEPHALHIWPRGSFMLIALPNQDGSFTCTLFLPFTSRQGLPGFDALADAADAEAFFARFFPDARALIPDLGAQFAAAPLGQMVTVRCARWSAGPALLLGDAAHAIVPFFGQGMNAGLEDCTLLDARLEDALARAPRGSLDWAALFADFSKGRKPDCDAIADLALENFVEMRDWVAEPRFLLERAIEAELQKRLGASYRSRYQLVTFSRVPYRIARAAGELQATLLSRASDGKSSLGEVDLDRAEAEMARELVPFLRAHGVID